MGEFRNTEFGQIPSQWDLKRVDEIKSGDKHAISMGPFGSNITVDNFVADGVPVIRGTNLNYERYVDGEFAFVSDAKADQLLSSNCKPGDLIFTHRGSIGQVGIIPFKTKYERYVVSQSGMKLSINKNIADPLFVFYFFKSKYGQYQLLRNESQVGVPSISTPLTSLKEIEIPLPLLPEQKSIASVLGSLDDKIDLLHRQNKTLEALAETLFRQWFVEEAAERWETQRLYDVIELVGGGTPKTEMTEYWDGKIKWISARDITPNHKGFITDTEKTITELGIEKSSTKILPQYATVISARGTVGKYCLLAEDMAFSQSNYGIKPRYENCYFFTYLLVANCVDELQAAAYGSVFDTITTNTFKEHIIQLPPEHEIRQFEENIKPYFEKMLKNCNQISTLTRLRDTLLPKLMSGEVRVSMSSLWSQDHE